MKQRGAQAQYLVMPAKAGIQHAGRLQLTAGVSEYWIIRLRG
jgi:hypothetical protein